MTYMSSVSLRECDSVTATFMLCDGSACASESRLANRVRKSHDSVALEAAAVERGRRESATPCTVLWNDCVSISLMTLRCSATLMGSGSSGGRGSVRAHLNELLWVLPYLRYTLCQWS